jgi:hypothetical protein
MWWQSIISFRSAMHESIETRAEEKLSGIDLRAGSWHRFCLPLCYARLGRFVRRHFVITAAVR